MHHRRRAFTLIELLVVVTIVAVLAAIALPLINRVQNKGYETKTLSNMRAMGVALIAFAGDNNMNIPGRMAAVNGVTPPKWPQALQPYVQDLTVYGSPIPDVGGKTYKVPNPTVYVNQNVTNFTSYIYNGGNDSAANAGLPYDAQISHPRLNVIAYPSQTILLGVPLPQANNFYMDFTEQNNSMILNKTAFADGTPYVFADGSARSLSVDPQGTVATNKSAPASSAYYSDWLWLFDKNRTDIIQ